MTDRQLGQITFDDNAPGSGMFLPPGTVIGINEVQPPLHFIIPAGDGNFVDICLSTGKVTFNGCTPDEAAKAFWDAIERMHPGAIGRSDPRVRDLMERDPSLTAEGAQGLVTQCDDEAASDPGVGAIAAAALVGDGAPVTFDRRLNLRRRAGGEVV
jgi:hypothetical protein